MPTVVRVEQVQLIGISRARLRILADRMLAGLGLGQSELSLLVTSDQRIRELNRRYRHQDRPTDVLSFPMDGPAEAGTVPQLLGDIVVSLDTARRQARSRGHRLVEELVFLLAHGLLHLLGHDHAKQCEATIMRRMTSRLVRMALGESSGRSKGRQRGRVSHA